MHNNDFDNFSEASTILLNYKSQNSIKMTVQDGLGIRIFI